MFKLIRADLARMFKTASFYVCGLLMIGVVLLNLLYSVAAANLSKEDEILAEYLQSGGLYVSCFVPIFIALFIGTDYYYGTIRNKITTGHGRCSIYLANLIVGTIGGVIYFAVYLAVVSAAILGIGWFPEQSIDELMYRILISFGIVISMCSLLSVVGMAIKSKASAVTLTVAIVAGMFIINSLLIDQLHSGEYRNPTITGLLREVLIHFCSLLPFGQALQLTFFEPVREVWAFPIYSAAFIAAMTGIGLLLFGKKDLK